jgi:hypothetical protein
VMIDACDGSPFTYAVTRSGAAKCRLPTIATRNCSQPEEDALLPICEMFFSNIARSLCAWRS